MVERMIGGDYEERTALELKETLYIYTHGEINA